jgi:uncharacterized repeat protein (TIGR01451 family)
VAADIEISQVGPKQNIAPGGVTSYTVYVVNNGGAVSDLTLLDTWNVKMTDPSVSKMWDSGILPEFQTYTASLPDAVTSFTHTVDNTNKRGVATWELASLPAGGSFEVVFTLTIPITTQPALDNYEIFDNLPSGVKGVGPTLLDNSAQVQVGTETPVSADPWTSVYIAAPLLDVTMSAVGETAGVDSCRIGRLVTYTIAVENVITYDREVRPDGLPATNLVISNYIPSQIQGQVLNVEAMPGVTIDKQNTYIRWIFPPTFVLTRGETTVMTFTARVPIDTVYYPGAKYLVTKGDSLKRIYELFAHADGMPFRDASLEDDHEVRILSPFDKVVQTTSPPSGDAKTYPNRMITYTLTFYNPSVDLDLINFEITDKLYETFTYSKTLEGNFSNIPRISGTFLIWEDLGVGKNGAISTSFLVHVGPQTPVEEGYSCGLEYPNSVTATTTLSPATYIGHYYGSFGDKKNELAPLDVVPQLDLDKTVDPNRQMPGSEVTYTIQIQNDGDITIPVPIVITDVLPSSFSFSQMVAGMVSNPIIDGDALVWRDVPTLTADGTPSDTVQFSYRVIVDGFVGQRYRNTVYGYSPETSLCSDYRDVRIISPIGITKTARPTQVVQGNIFSYTVGFGNLNPRAMYTLTDFWDTLDSPFSSNPTGLINPENEGLEYTHTLPTPFRLEYGATSWNHRFEAFVKGTGTCLESSCWCDKRLSDPTKPIEQPEGHVCGTVIDEDGYASDGCNADDLAPLYVRPHVSLIQQAYPNPVAIGEVVTIVLTLRDNRVNPITQVTGVHLKWTLPNEDFTLLSADPPTTSQAGGDYFWNDIDVPNTGNKMVQIILRLRTPWHRVAGWSRSFSANAKVIGLDDHSICIPGTNKFLISDSGSRDPAGGPLPWQFPEWGDEKLDTLKVNQGIEVDKKALGLGFGDKEIGPYSVVEYEMTVENLTGAPVPSVVITDILPSLQGESPWSYVEIIAGPDPKGDDPPYWDLGVLQPETSVEFNFTARASAWLGGAFNDFEASAPINVGYSRNYTDNVMVYVVSGVGLFKDASPDNIQPGDVTTYTITLYNGKSDDLEQVAITDTLPVGFTFEDMVSSSPSAGDPAVDNTTLVWQLPEDIEIEGDGGKLEIVFRARADSEGMFKGTYYNQVDAFAVNASTQDVVVMPPTGPTAPVYVDGLPTVEAGKTVAPEQILAGESVTYTITLYNEADAPRTLRITDTLPSDFMLESPISPTTVMTASGAGGRQQLVWDSISIGAQAWQTLTFRAGTAVDIPAGLLYYNAVQVGFDSFVLPERPKLAPVQVVELPKGDIQVDKTDGQLVAEPGKTLDYTIAYTNVSEALTFQSVILTETIDPAAYVIGPTSGWTDLGGGNYRRVVNGSLLPGQSGTVNFSVELTGTIPSSITQLYNTVVIDYVPMEESTKINPDDDIAQDVNFIGSDQPILAMKQSVPLNEVGAGKEVTYTITLYNQDVQTHTLNVIDTLPLSFTLASAVSPPDGFEWSAGQQRVIWEDIAIDVGETKYIVFRAKVNTLAPASQNRCNTVQVERDGVPQAPVEEQACLEVLPIAWVDARVSKDDGEDWVKPGDNLLYTIQYANDQGSDLPLQTIILTETVSPLDNVEATGWLNTPPGASTQNLGGGTYRIDIPGPLDAGASDDVIFFVQLKDPIPLPDEGVQNFVEMGYTTSEPALESNTIDNKDDDPDGIQSGAGNVLVVKKAEPGSVSAGQLVTYTITLYNDSSQSRVVRVTDTLPMYFTLAASIYPQSVETVWEAGYQRAVWKDIEIPPQGTWPIIFQAKTDALAPTGLYCNRVQIQRNGVVQNEVTRLACVDVTEVKMMDAQVTQDNGTLWAEAGQTLDYIIRYTNTASSELSFQKVLLTEVITPVEALEVLSSDWTALGDGRYQREIIDPLDPGQGRTVQFTVRVTDTLPTDLQMIRSRVTLSYTTSGKTLELNTQDNTAEDVDVIRESDVERKVLATKYVLPTTAAAGRYVTYTLVLFNDTELDKSLVVTDTLPAFFTLDSADPSGVTTAWQGDRQQVIWRDIDVYAGGERNLLLRAKIDRAAPSGQRCNAMQVAVGGEAQPELSGLACVEVTGLRMVDAHIAKDNGRDAVRAGQRLTYTLQYGSATSSELSLQNVGLTEIITPADLVDVVSTGWTSLGNGRYERQVDPLLPGMVEQETFIVRVVDTIPDGVQVLRNYAAIDYTTSAPVFDSNATNNVARDDDTIQRSGEILAIKRVTPRVIYVGQLVTYTITLSNPNASSHTLRVIDTLPASFALDAAIDPPDVVTGSLAGKQQVIWEDLSIAANGTRTLVFRAKVDPAAAGGLKCNSVRIYRDSVDQGDVTPLACVDVVKVPTVDVQVAKDDDATSFDAGKRVVYTIAYTNSATADQVSVHDIVLRDTISPTAYVTFDGGPWQPLGGGQYAYTHSATLPPGASGQVTIAFRVADELPDDLRRLVNAVTLDYQTEGKTVELDPADNEDEDVDILSGAENFFDLTITNPRLSPTQPKSGESLRITMTIHNPGTLAIDQDFYVAAYLRDASAGPPTDIFDQEGRVCMPQFTNTLDVGTSSDIACSATAPAPQVSTTYTLYGQVDVALNSQTPVTGLVNELYEDNNLVTGATIHIPAAPGGSKVYLPLVLKQ